MGAMAKLTTTIMIGKKTGYDNADNRDWDPIPVSVS